MEVEREAAILRQMRCRLRLRGGSGGELARNATFSAVELARLCDALASHQGHLAAAGQRTLLDAEFLRAFLLGLRALRIESVGSSRHRLRRSYLHFDLAHSPRVRQLELRGVDLDLVTGLEYLRSSLRTLHLSSCGRVCLRRLLVSCLGDNCREVSPWERLIGLCVSHGCIRGLEPDVTVLLPNLRRLDLSFNGLESLEGLDSLRGLTHLILGYNRLRRLPLLCPASLDSLRYLHLQHNELEVIDGLEKFSSLVELDLGWNLLIHHSVLAPISLMPHLSALNLAGNPLSARADHRIRTLSWVHQRVDPAKFILDGLPVSSKETPEMGMSRMVARPPQHVSVAVEQVEDELGTSSIVSEQTSASEGRRRRCRRIREVLIEDPKHPNDEKDRMEATSFKKKSHLKGESSAHLETKRQIEDLRKTYGQEDWLQGVAGEQLHNVLGLEKPDPRSTSQIIAQRLSDIQTREERIDKFLKDSAGTCQDEIERMREIMEKNGSELTLVAPSQSGDTSSNSEMTSSFYSMYSGHKGSSDKDASDRDDVLVVNVMVKSDRDNLSPAVLRVHGDYVQEESLEGVLRHQWYVHSLEVCELLSDCVVAVEFGPGSGSKSRASRLYQMNSSEDADALLEVARPVLEAQARHALRLGVLQCIKCQAQFSRGERAHGEEQYSCPNCKSSMVIALDSTPVPSEEKDNSKEDDDDGVTPVQSTTGSVNERNFLRNIRKFSTPRKESSTEIEVITAKAKDKHVEYDRSSKQGSATPTGSQQDTPLPCSESSSDISVLSNPSQSSIEVLTQKLHQQVQIVSNTSGTTVEDVPQHYEKPDLHSSALTPVKRMMESSSSGSMAESIMTTHELETPQHVKHDREDDVDEAYEVAEDVLEQLNSMDAKSGEDISDSGYFSHRNNELVAQQKQQVQQRSNSSNDTEDDSASFRTCLSDLSLNLTAANSITRLNKDDESEEDGCVEGTPKANKQMLHSPLASGGLRQVAGPLSLYSVFNSGNTNKSSSVIVGEKLPDDALESLAIAPGLMSWDYSDFTSADHRVKLYCDLTLCEEGDESVLLLARSRIGIKVTGKVFIGVLIVTNKKIQVMRITRTETEDPSEWLVRVDGSGLRVSQLVNLKILFGGQGLSIETKDGEAIQVLLGDRQRSEGLRDQINVALLENARSVSVPISETSTDELKELGTQMRQWPKEEVIAGLFNGYTPPSRASEAKRISVVLSETTCAIFSDVFKWMLTKTGGRTPLAVKVVFQIKNVQSLGLYDDHGEKLRLTLEGGEVWDFFLETENSVFSFVKSLKAPWEAHHGKDFEDVLLFNLTKDNQVLRLHHTQMQDSSDPALSEWIQVIKRKLSA